MPNSATITSGRTLFHHFCEPIYDAKKEKRNLATALSVSVALPQHQRFSLALHRRRQGRTGFVRTWQPYLVVLLAQSRHSVAEISPLHCSRPHRLRFFRCAKRKGLPVYVTTPYRRSLRVYRAAQHEKYHARRTRLGRCRRHGGGLSIAATFFAIRFNEHRRVSQHAMPFANSRVTYSAARAFSRAGPQRVFGRRNDNGDQQPQKHDPRSQSRFAGPV